MAQVNLRRNFNRPLTREEIDNNFDNLNNFKVEKTANGSVQVDGPLTLNTGATNGVRFRDNAFGGTGDQAYISLEKYGPVEEDNQKLVIKMANDPGDIVEFQIPSNYGVLINGFNVWHSGNDQPFIRRRRNRYGSGNSNTLDSTLLEMGYNFSTAGVAINGPFITFGGLNPSTDSDTFPNLNNSDFQCQLTAESGNGGKRIAFRTKNSSDSPVGDSPANAFNSWSYLWHTNNVSQGSGIVISQANPSVITVSHSNTSDVPNLDSNNTAGVVIQDLALNFDEFGHVTSRSVVVVNLDDRYYTEAEADTRFVNAVGDSMSGTLTMSDANIQLSNNFGLVWTGNTDTARIRFNSVSDATTFLDFILEDNGDEQFRFLNNGLEALRFGQGVFAYKGNTVWHSANDGSGSGLDADLLDGLDSSQFVRSDIDATKAGNLSLSNGSLFIQSGSLFISSATAQLDVACPANFERGIIVNEGNFSGVGVVLSDDGDWVDNNDGYGTFRFSQGLKITNGKNSNTTTITLQGTNGHITATQFNGLATRANYADLAENYTSDDKDPGTFMMVDAFGDNETIKASVGNEDLVIGIISTNPAYLMNSELENGTPLALKGRVPAKVIGKVKKGDRLGLSLIPGVGVVTDRHTMPIKVIALGNKDTEEIGLVEVVIV